MLASCPRSRCCGPSVRNQTPAGVNCARAQIQTLEDASVLSVVRVILDFMEDLPKLQKRYLDAAS